MMQTLSTTTRLIVRTLNVFDNYIVFVQKKSMSTLHTKSVDGRFAR
jgi:hypothetical protein